MFDNVIGQEFSENDLPISSYRVPEKGIRCQTRKAFEEFRRENECKTKECQEALRSLKDLQNELVRKSMHVVSLGIEPDILGYYYHQYSEEEKIGSLLILLVNSFCHQGISESEEQVVFIFKIPEKETEDFENGST